MLNYTRLLVILALVYGAVFLLAIGYSGQQSSTQKASSNSASFLMPGDLNEDYDYEVQEKAPEKKVAPKSTPAPKKMKKLVKKIKVVRQPKAGAATPAPVFNYNPFELLGAYPDPKTHVAAPLYNVGHYAMINDDDYCKTVDLYNLEHPENMFEKMNFYTDVKQENMMRHKVLNKVGTLYMTDLDKTMTQKMSQSKKYHIDKEINDFVLFTSMFPRYHQIGKHYLCATQMTNHIPNLTALTMKEKVKQTVEEYSLKYQDKPQCFDKNSFYPLTYRLFDKKECEEFFGIINSEQYNTSLETEPIQYIIKLGQGTHKATGVFLLDTNETIKLQKDYDHGAKCGRVTKSLIAQKYIANPLLLDHNNKFHMRVYLLITSTNPLIVYQQDGYIRASINHYDKFSEDRATHLTNVLVDEFFEARKENKTIMGMTPDELDDYNIWSYDELQDYLLEIGKIKDNKWVDNHLRPALQKAFIHLVRMTSSFYWKQSNVYELLGCDFILDDDLGVWFLEANSSPQVDGVQDDIISRMLFDLLEVQYSYMRSRMKRAVDVIKRMQAENGNGEVKNLDKWKGLFQEAIKNKLEPEYKLKDTNTFRLIVDESLPGAQAYFGLISEECMNP